MYNSIFPIQPDLYRSPAEFLYALSLTDKTKADISLRALLGKEEAEEKIRTHWLCLPVHKIESDIQLRLQTATINSETENSTKQIHSNKFVPIKNREGNAETTTGKTGCLDKYNTAYPVTNSKYLYHFSRKESGRFEHPDNYFYFCGLLKRIILKSNNEHVW